MCGWLRSQEWTAADACAPHVKNTGEIGMIRLLGMQAYKGGVRISMLCGERALEQAFMVQDQIEQLGVLFFCAAGKCTECRRKASEETGRAERGRRFGLDTGAIKEAGGRCSGDTAPFVDVGRI